MARTISQNTKDRLKEAVHDLTILVDDGLHPTNALVKVAKSLDLTDDQTRLVGRAYNTAHTSDVREKGAGILEKLATTPIADCEEAVSKLNTTKTASADEIANIYSTNLDISQLRGLSTKVAEDISLQTCKLASTKKAEPIKEASLNKLLSDSKLLDLEISKLAGKAELLKDNLNAATIVLKKYADKVSDPILIATKLAAVQQFGKEVLPYLEDCFNVENPTMKLASYDEDLMTRIKKAFEYGQELAEMVQLLNKVAQCRNAVNGDIKKKVGTEKVADAALDIQRLSNQGLRMQQQHERNQAQADRQQWQNDKQQMADAHQKKEDKSREDFQKYRDQVQQKDTSRAQQEEIARRQAKLDASNKNWERAGLVAGKGEEYAKKLFTSKKIREVSDDTQNVVSQMWQSPLSPASPLARLLGLETSQSPPIANQLVGSQVSLIPSHIQYGVRTPSHQKALDSIRIKSVVNDMLSNDEIISQYEPEEVYQVYNELMATAPEAMSRPMVARSFVREALAKGGILGSYDLSPIMSYDKDIERNIPRKQKENWDATGRREDTKS